MFETTSGLISKLLGDAVAGLDIPPELRRAATDEYERVGNWLTHHADGASGWIVYPQGSFSLNTVVLPSGSDEYDVDTVCLRNIGKEETTQAELKHGVGKVLGAYVDAHRPLPDGPASRRERKRCWTLEYPAALRFHLDVLPAIPNVDSGGTAILITDRGLHRWQFSDPLAFAEWFKGRAAAEFVAKRARLAAATHIPPQAIPDWEVKTNLQRVVQVLKLHRNEHFRNDLDARPASILLTTLAGHAYGGDQDLYEAVLHTVEGMPAYIQEDGNGFHVPNPVEPDENFADRWRSEPERARQFFNWLAKLEEDLREAESVRGLDKVAARLSTGFGAGPIEKATDSLGETYRRTREEGSLRFGATTGLLSTGGGTAVRNHDFYGDDPD